MSVKVDFLANDSIEALDLKEALEKNGYEVNHIHSGSSKPIVLGKNMHLHGAGNIRTQLTVKK